MLTGRGSTVGAALVEDPRVRAISFTGSVATGHGVRDSATKAGKRVQLELGGHNPMIVMDDADLGRAVEAAYAGAFWSAGQKCTATRRIYVQDDVYDAFREQFLARIDRGRVGDPLDPDVEVGPIVNEAQFDEIVAAIARGRDDGGTVIAGGERADEHGYLIPPTVFEGVADNAFLSCEEVFGPVTSLYRFATLDEALDARERGRVRPLDGDLHLEPRERDPLHRRGAGRVDPCQLADGGRRGARAVRRHQGERLRPARAGPRSDRVLHRDGHRLRRSVSASETSGFSSPARSAASARGPAASSPRRARRWSGYDLGTDDRRLRLAGAEGVEVVRGDITDRAALDRLLDERAITHVDPSRRAADPPDQGEPAARDCDQRRRHRQRARRREDPRHPRRLRELGGGLLAGRRHRRRVPNDAPGHPTTFYGVHKQACEGLARIFWQEEQVPSIGIRPFIVYGPGRDSGLTASPSLAMAAAARGESSQIAFGGRTQLQYAPDAARVFVGAARAATEGARVFNLGGPAVSLAETAQAIEEAAGVSCTVDEDTLLPFPEEFDNGALDEAIGAVSWTPLQEGVRATIDRLRAAPG